MITDTERKIQEQRKAKRFTELEAMSVRHQNLMSNALMYFDTKNELRNDIAKVFDSPTLWAAIDKLIEYTEKFEETYAEMKSANITMDDACIFKFWGNQNEKFND